ncbi:methylated-DNA--[protein]-cysteine S-methyltransferase [Rubinisphaera brasiliensis]|uniref:methylated-DNA--[protein]-cysteine S-methyltransferase n=1 Tax=Rubinisphaera brasiliensis (strain ATCC 49424 / DSM 5305 / JCM 21570 / IAM 15109 / NBRC 103401 / IFAM 1448) TaxID=756272 RepID=F0SH33_RUBBR|nr:methylated-DNA--[protein]-cysteine S-methyltransferase [Rubinisphaera brasiliensis]ADY59518.1 methylated-DNA/protein-cysteinemethyltransferase [Rubinisphaera brasiliensis DSM 5305]
MKLTTPRNLCSFETELGWMLLAGTDRQVLYLSIGNRSAEHAEQRWHESGLFEADASPVDSDWYPEARELLTAYAAGEVVELDKIVCNLPGRTPFQRDVLQLVQRIPRGEVLTYGEVAKRVGRPGAARAVGATMASNTIPLIIPCHRVVGANGRLTGFSAPRGIDMKRQLLDLEQTPTPVLF